jgi:hypothetical protein
MSATTTKELNKAIASEENRDPISGAPGAHPVGTGVGAALGGAAAGAAAGTVVGPVGTIVGAAVGAIVGGLAGKGVAEAIDPTRELGYWRENYQTRPYADKATAFDEFEPAYGYGLAAYTKYPGRSFDDVDADLARDWNASRGQSNLTWDRARFASRDAWDRVSMRS